MTSSRVRPPACTAFAFLVADETRLLGGRTYPQEGPLTLDAFTAYFFGATALIGVVSEGKVEGVTDGEKVEVGLEEACAGRKWEACVGGTYYV